MTKTEIHSTILISESTATKEIQVTPKVSYQHTESTWRSTKLQQIKTTEKTVETQPPKKASS